MIMRNIFLILVVIFFAGCQTVKPTYTGPSFAVSTPQIPAGNQHKVAAKETLWKISQIYNVEISDILHLNHLAEDAKIEPGQILLIPKSSTSSLPVNAGYVNSRHDDFIWPLRGKIIAGFGSVYHNLAIKGINIQSSADADVLASRSGRVVFYAANLGNFGKTIIIDHGDGLRSLYAHIAEIFVRPGDNIERGAVLGRLGVLGDSSYLYFEICKGALPQNPLFYLP